MIHESELYVFVISSEHSLMLEAPPPFGEQVAVKH